MTSWAQDRHPNFLRGTRRWLSRFCLEPFSPSLSPSEACVTATLTTACAGLPPILIAAQSLVRYPCHQHGRFRCPLRWESRADPRFSRETNTRVIRPKQFKTYTEQVELLRTRGMSVDNQARAEHLLARLNYYRLSGYWYPMRRFSPGTDVDRNEFIDGASFDLVVDLYEFDERLRHSVVIDNDCVVETHGDLASSVGVLTWLGIALYLVGAAINTGSEAQRMVWKKRPENKGKLYTEGMFAWSMHVNYFGDVLHFLDWAIVAGATWSLLIPAVILCMFVFLNIPMLDSYLAQRYGEQFTQYSRTTKKLILGIY